MWPKNKYKNGEHRTHIEAPSSPCPHSSILVCRARVCTGSCGGMVCKTMDAFTFFPRETLHSPLPLLRLSLPLDSTVKPYIIMYFNAFCSTTASVCCFHFFSHFFLHFLAVFSSLGALRRILRETPFKFILLLLFFLLLSNGEFLLPALGSRTIATRFISIELWIKLFIVNTYIFTTLPVNAVSFCCRLLLVMFFSLSPSFSFFSFHFFVFLQQCGFGFCEFPEPKPKWMQETMLWRRDRRERGRERENCRRNTIAAFTTLPLPAQWSRYCSEYRIVLNSNNNNASLMRLFFHHFSSICLFCAIGGVHCLPLRWALNEEHFLSLCFHLFISIL